MSTLKPLTDYSFKMLVISDLGMKKPTENYYKKVRMAIFECTHCKSHFETVVTKKAQNQMFCETCNGVSNRKPNRNHKLYKIWADTKAKLKCDNPHAIAYLNKQIVMCREWESSYDCFYDWATNSGYKEGLTIDRIDNDKHYTPDNCRWVNHSVQMANQRVLKRTNTSGYKGVSSLAPDRWLAGVRFEGKYFNLGTFTTAVEAGAAYDSFVSFMGWPHSNNNLLKTHGIQFPKNKTTVKFLSSLGIHEGNFASKEP